MGYYDDDEYYGNYYDDEDRVEPVSIIGDGFSEEAVSDIILSTGLTAERRPKYSGSMEKLVFMYGDGSEVYSPAEIRFIECIEDVIVYPDFFKTLNQRTMVCRAIATKIDCSGHDALRSCVIFEKIINKALDGFNIFFLVTEDNVYFGCRVFNKNGKKDCALSNPIFSEYEFEQLVDELAFLTGIDSFMEYYSHFWMTITDGQSENKDYELMMMRRRGVQMSYLDDICKIERDMGINLSKEKERYRRMFYDDAPETSYGSLFEEIEESLSFIKSNRVNTYEMLFEAEEMMHQADKTEADNARLAAQAALQTAENTDSESDEEARALLDDPEEMIKLLKKRRGI